jgi:biotin carboxyl carrier protein
LRYLARVGEKEVAVELERRGQGLAVRVDGEERAVEARRAGPALLMRIDGRSLEAIVVRESGTGAGRGGSGGQGARGAVRSYGVAIGGRVYGVELEDPLARPGAGPGHEIEGRVEVRSIMPGRVTALLVVQGQAVKSGQGLVVVEAMKMENEIPAPKDGTITSVRVKPGETVEAGAVLLTVD